MHSPLITGDNPQQNKLCDMVPAARMMVERIVCDYYRQGMSIRQVRARTGLALRTIHCIVRKNNIARSYKAAYDASFERGQTRIQKKKAKLACQNPSPSTTEPT